VSDLNYGGHLGNDRMLALIHEARAGFLASRGQSERDCGGASLIMGDAVIQFRAEAFAGDLLRFEVVAGEAAAAGFRIFYRATRPADGRTVALAETGMVTMDPVRRKVRPLPDAVRAFCLESGDEAD
jgi:acyl-CoA thioesterase FadM